MGIKIKKKKHFFNVRVLFFVKLVKIKEKQMPTYGYISFVCIYLLAVLFYFISKNFYFLMILMMVVLIIPILAYFIKTIKRFDFLLLSYALIMVTINFALCYFNLMYLIPLAILFPFLVYCIVKSIYGIIKNQKRN